MLLAMADPYNIAARMSALETQVRDLAERVRNNERDAVAARVLAGGADRDVAEMRKEIREFREQNTRVLNARREDLTDLRQRMDDGFAQLDRQFTRVDEAFVKVDLGFTEMCGKLDATAVGQQHIAELLNRLIDQQDCQ
jgi:hypothetical protein